MTTLTARILELHREGLKPPDIARQIGRETNYVTAILAAERKRQRLSEMGLRKKPGRPKKEEGSRRS